MARDQRKNGDSANSEKSRARLIREKLFEYTPLPPNVIKWGYASLPLGLITVGLVAGWVFALILLVVLLVLFVLAALLG